MDVDEVDVIEWKLPAEVRKIVTQCIGWTSLGIVTFLTIGNFFMMNSRRATTFQTLSLLMVGLLLIYIWIMTRQIDRAEKATFFADEQGFHGRPLFDFNWPELLSVSTVNWLLPETRLLIIRARSPWKTRTMITGSYSVELLHLLEFANRKIAEADPSA